MAVVAVVPAMAELPEEDDALTRHLDRLEQELSAGPALIADPDRTRGLLRHLRWLDRYARSTPSPDLRQRIDALELRIKTGNSPTAPKEATTADKLGALAGTVTAASSGQPLAHVSVYLWDAQGFFLDTRATDVSGHYSFANLEAGEYLAATENFIGYIDELYDDVPCPAGGFGCDLTTGEPIEVGDQGTAQVDFALDLGGAIAGTVTDAATGEPLQDVSLQVWNSDRSLAGERFSDAQGNYRIAGLTPGTYFVTTENFAEYLDEIYDDLPCRGGGHVCDPTAGDPVTVELETTTSGIDFALGRLSAISGRITDSIFGDPIPFVDLAAWDERGSVVAFGFTDESGSYRIGGLAEGIYFVTTSNFWSFEDELYDDLPCPLGSCNPTDGTPIAVTLDSTTDGIDFILDGGCFDSDTSLCLNGDRFRVEATWRNFADATGSGHAVELTDDTGYFWFFAEANVELVVKVLDACTLPGFNSFWVFAGGLTGVEVELTVTDTRSGQSQQYTNSLGTPFQPIQDTGAFNTCP